MEQMMEARMVIQKETALTIKMRVMEAQTERAIMEKEREVTHRMAVFQLIQMIMIIIMEIMKTKMETTVKTLTQIQALTQIRTIAAILTALIQILIILIPMKITIQ